MLSTFTDHSINAARLHLLVRAEVSLALPPYAGSMLRGAFGHALLALSPLPHDNGQPCALQAQCAYCQVFASQPLPAHSLQKFSQMPVPYVVEPPTDGPQRLLAGQPFCFSLVLFGKAWQHLPTIVLAWERALHQGLGVLRSRCTLLAVQAESTDTHTRAPLWQAGQSYPTAPTLSTPPLSLNPLAQSANLHFHTPLRLQIQGKPACAHDLSARHLLITLARRWQLLQDVYLGPEAPQLDFAALSESAHAIQIHAQDMQWVDWGRYSDRQQQAMQFGGLVGKLQLKGELAPFMQLLHLGQWLHVGKNTSFGLGGYTLDAQP